MSTYSWRGPFHNSEVNALHAQAFGGRLYSDQEWDWEGMTARHSLGWVVARQDGTLIGFVNVPWDGFIHAWLQDVMVAADASRRGIGRQLVATAKNAAAAAGCEYLHVDFEPDLQEFYLGSCGFEPTTAGLIRL
ncbi:GNAT superfamily N-acetyltransferase [Nakamurella sp. UYEF19]|uniref:GNAT family N-acetyltransferase n=1 Tax=Nakamurella sp. UYEF19 TaxID=1756392 RepID=UPI003392AD31